VGSPRIQFEPRFVAPADLQVFFNAADAIVLPFRDVLTSASLVLAMGFGRMVVAPRLGCIPDYADAEGCVLYEASREGALDAAMQEALSRDTEACGRHNMARARALDWAAMAQQTASVYEELATGSAEH
jgi:glycosyltransferase involved in cell wall biosynthesis